MYTAFNQKGRAIGWGLLLSDVINHLDAFRYYFIMNSSNEVVINELKGKPLPKRTSHGTPKG